MKTKDPWKQWNFDTSTYILQTSFYFWKILMQVTPEDKGAIKPFRRAFFHYLNYGHTSTYYY